MSRYRLLDPRPEALGAELDWLRTHQALGVAVEVPELAEACSWGNLDADAPAIEAALEREPWPAPPWVVTASLDVEAICAMAIMMIKEDEQLSHGSGCCMPTHCCCEPDERDQETGLLVEVVARARQLGEGAVTELDAVRATCEDHTLALEDRVDLVASWLLTGSLPARDGVAVHRLA